MKDFIITIDTEGDNLWDYHLGETITTKNAHFIPRFQTLCEKYNFKPVYLVNYEMAQDEYFVNFAKNILQNNNCEIGIHLHAWNSPPYYELKNGSNTYGLPYLIEYPKNIMDDKFNYLYGLLNERFNIDIISHRSGRWAMNQDYFDILINHNVKVDCSVTPYVSWNNARGFSINSKGTDYTKNSDEPYIIQHSSREQTLLEMPVTIRKFRHFDIVISKLFHPKYFISTITNIINGKPIWLRPKGNNLSDMLTLINNIQESESPYLMFMLHSSELMPGGSPTFKTSESIEKLYKNLEILFNIIASNFRGITLKDYYLNHLSFQ